MSNQQLKRAADSAIGPLSGYLFQFEKALLLLAGLNNSDEFVSIEEIDDVSTHSPDGTVILAMQAKHSIASSGSTFSDTSSALWRTLELWVDKVKKGILTDSTTFVCATNKSISNTSLLYKIVNHSFSGAIKKIEELLEGEENKLKKINETEVAGGSTVKQIISRIKFILKNQDSFKIIQKNLKISDRENILEDFFNQLHMGADQITLLQKQRTYQEFYGWIVSNSKARWLNAKEARFTKKSFDEKWYYIRTNPAIVSAIIRTKESLGSISNNEILSKKKELFVRQIEDIRRNENAKARIIQEAILNFIYTEIEIKHIIDKGDFTDDDFVDFVNQCRQSWQSTFDMNVIRELEEYTDDEKNEIAIKIFDSIMNEIKVEFKDGFSFTTSNTYVQKGCFLRLSNEPTIGWHPEWEVKYRLNEKR